MKTMKPNIQQPDIFNVPVTTMNYINDVLQNRFPAIAHPTDNPAGIPTTPNKKPMAEPFPSEQQEIEKLKLSHRNNPRPAAIATRPKTMTCSLGEILQMANLAVYDGRFDDAETLMKTAMAEMRMIR